jgi:hypothetical protein
MTVTGIDESSVAIPGSRPRQTMNNTVDLTTETSMCACPRRWTRATITDVARRGGPLLSASLTVVAPRVDGRTSSYSSDASSRRSVAIPMSCMSGFVSS